MRRAVRAYANPALGLRPQNTQMAADDDHRVSSRRPPVASQRSTWFQPVIAPERLAVDDDKCVAAKPAVDAGLSLLLQTLLDRGDSAQRAP
jgi:hypothetical protein